MKYHKYISITLIMVIAFLLYLLSSFVSDIHRFYTNGTFVYPNSLHNFYRVERKPATLSDVGLISKWMTFSYINKSFNLSPDYLKTALNINDKSYPSVTISKVATEQGLSISIYLETVKKAVSDHFVQNTTPQK